MKRPVFAVEDPGDLGSTLRGLRHSQDLTLYDVEDTMGSAARTLSAWELGKKLIKVDKLVEVLAAYGYVMVFMPRAKADELTGGTR